MVSTVSYAMPAGVLGGLCAAMILFIWWWFPRTWKRGVAQENAELDAVDMQAHREQVVSNAKSIIDNYRETLKQRELSKNANANSNEAGDIEAQDSTTNPAPPLYSSADSQTPHIHAAQTPTTT